MERIIALIIFIFILAIIAFLLHTINIYINNRISIGLLDFNNSSYNVKFGDIPRTYYNKYFKKNMDLCVCDFYWATSNKSYLPCGEYMDLTSYDVLKLVLDKGARVINLDIYSSENDKIGENAEPIVKQANLMPSYGEPLKFDECCKIISDNAWKHNNEYPLILYLNLNTDNKYVCDKVAESLLLHFNNKFLDKIYSYNGRDGENNYGTVPISQHLGKVGILSNNYPTNSELDELINLYLDNNVHAKRIDYNDQVVKYGGLNAVLTDIKGLIEFNRLNISYVEPKNNMDILNLFTPKYDLNNIDYKDAHNYGCQFVALNYQLYNDEMKQYIELFKNSSLVLKPDDLREIPKPKPIIMKQYKQLSYGSRALKQDGWYDLKI